jgi:4-hydroxy-3-polyprenylbenzoate decarboxylase
VAAAAGGAIPSLGEFSGLEVPTAPADSTASPIPDPADIDSRVLAHTVLEDCLMVVHVAGEGRPVVERLLRADLGPVKLVAAVSPDIPLDDRELVVWGVFTRFDCARDVLFTEVQHRGAWTTCHGIMGIDATFKPGYPAPLEMDPDIVAKVDRRWNEYAID